MENQKHLNEYITSLLVKFELISMILFSLKDSCVNDKVLSSILYLCSQVTSTAKSDIEAYIDQLLNSGDCE